ncbi:MAG: prepilin peptidase [Puniceicoccaceae bacterium]
METIAILETTAPWVMPVGVFILGACIGSFLNVCIVRIPAGESLWWPPSHAADGRRLSWWENVPILAWFYLRGRDRVTGEPYSFRYPFVELLTAVLFGVCWWMHSPLVALAGMILLSLLIVGSFIDLDHMILPDGVTIVGMIVGVLLSFWIPEMHLPKGQSPYLSDGFASGVISMISVLIGAGLVFWVGELGEVAFRKPAMGLGDVKLVGCIGAFCGWQGAVFSLFGGAVIGCVILLPLLLLMRRSQGKPGLRQNEDLQKETAGGNSGETTDATLAQGLGMEVPFGPMLALGGAVYFLGADAWVDPYFAMLAEMVFGR